MCAFELRENALGVEIHAGDQLLALYRATEELPRSESTKPCFAPLYTLSGQLVTEYRPPDHAWHTGLFFGWVHVNDANLWGGALVFAGNKEVRTRRRQPRRAAARWLHGFGSGRCD